MKTPGMKGISETWATKLDRSITEAQAIARRHSTGYCDNVDDQINIHDTTLRLIALLNIAKKHAIKS